MCLTLDWVAQVEGAKRAHMDDALPS
jgi:hypothetical protein